MSDENLSVYDASERLRRGFYINDPDTLVSPCQSNDAYTLAMAYLREHPADEHDAITPEWLVSVGFRHSLNPLWLMVDFGKENSHWLAIKKDLSECDIGQKVPSYDYDPQVPIPVPLTRGAVRSLCKALGIPLKEGAK